MKSLVVTSKNGIDKVAFGIAINAKKTFEEFYEHEKHWNFPKDAMKEFHNLIRKAAGINDEIDEMKTEPVKITGDKISAKVEQSTKVKDDVSNSRETIKEVEKSQPPKDSKKDS